MSLRAEQTRLETLVFWCVEKLVEEPDYAAQKEERQAKERERERQKKIKDKSIAREKKKKTQMRLLEESQ